MPEVANPLKRPMSPSESGLKSKRFPRRAHGTTTELKTTRSTGLYSNNFQQSLIDHVFFPVGYRYPNGQRPPPPANRHTIEKLLGRRRPSLSQSRFSEKDFQDLQAAEDAASCETDVAVSVIPIIEGAPGDQRCRERNATFKNLTSLTTDAVALTAVTDDALSLT